ncbi:hypothetical protein L593_12610 [Salinarchaeum sp. Harcht-Bsk1]|nr:hypothetical protein L593_12610 [Salinarchaeum sp. Harcht-Bsk1]
MVELRRIHRSSRTLTSAGDLHPLVTDWTREFPFELRVCRWAEHEWPPGEASLQPDQCVIVGRQLGTRERRWDTVVAICDAEALRTRAVFGERALDRNLLRVVRNAPFDFEWYRDALELWTTDWRYVREAVKDAADRDLIETRRRNNRIELRRRWEYPDWLEALIAIENKPDLDRSAADALADQMQRDVAFGLADEAWVATLKTGESAEPGLLADMPVEAGVLAVDPEAGDADVLWHPRSLAVEAPGTRIVDRPTGSEYDQSAAEFEYVDAEWKALARLAIAERLYERGWRSYVDSMQPDCRHFELETVGEDGTAALQPHCAAKQTCPTSWECSGRCSEYEPEPPAWRSKGWPIEGGPGKGLRSVLEARRARKRPK